MWLGKRVLEILGLKLAERIAALIESLAARAARMARDLVPMPSEVLA